MAADGSILIDTSIDASGVKDYVKELRNIEKEAGKVDAAIDKMRQKMGRHLELGGNADDKTYMRMQYDLAQLEIKQADYADKLAETRSLYQATGSAVSVAKEETKALGTESEIAHKKMSKGSTMSLKKMLLYSIGIESMYSIFSKLRRAASESFTELAKSNPQLNASLTSINNAMTNLKLNVGAVAAQIVEAFGPAITWAADKLSDLAYNVQWFLSQFTGKEVIKAAKSTAKAIGTVGSASEKALASYDKLEVISGGSGTGGGSGSGGGGGYASALVGDTGIYDDAERESSAFVKSMETLIGRVVEGEDLNWYEKIVRSTSIGIEAVVETFKAVEEHGISAESVLEAMAGTTAEVGLNMQNTGKKWVQNGGKMMQSGNKVLGALVAGVGTVTTMTGAAVNGVQDIASKAGEAFYDAQQGMSRFGSKLGDIYNRWKYGAEETVPVVITRMDAIKNSIEGTLLDTELQLKYHGSNVLKDEQDLFRYLQMYAEEGGDLSAYAFLNSYELPFKLRSANPYSSGSAYILEWIDANTNPVKETSANAGKEAGQSWIDSFSNSISNGKKTVIENLTDALESAKQKAAEVLNITTPAVATGSTMPTSSVMQKAVSGVTNVIDKANQAIEIVVNSVLDGKIIAKSVNTINANASKQSGKLGSGSW